MHAHALSPDRDEAPREDKIIVLHGMSWADFQRHLEARGDRPFPRLAYLDGSLQLMSPSPDHEELKSLIGCLIEVYCLERGIEFLTRGSWTVENKGQARGLEPDECYLFSSDRSAPRPDLAIEVVWTSGGLDKLDIYRGLGVREVWFWRRGAITIHRLRGTTYEEAPASVVLPGIDVAALASFLDRDTTSAAMRDYRAYLNASE